jgi:hypothetical protein
MKKFGVLFLVLLFTLAAAVPAYAAKPVVQTGTLDEVWELEGICPGIEVWDHEVGSYRATAFYDKQGNYLGYELHWSGVDNLYDPERPEFMLSGHYSMHENYDALTDQHAYFGIAFNITVPGYGTVLHESGRTFPSGRTVGKHSTLDLKGDDIQQLCSLLGGD